MPEREPIEAQVFVTYIGDGEQTPLYGLSHVNIPGIGLVYITGKPLVPHMHLANELFRENRDFPPFFADIVTFNPDKQPLIRPVVTSVAAPTVLQKVEDSWHFSERGRELLFNDVCQKKASGIHFFEGPQAFALAADATTRAVLVHAFPGIAS